MLTVLTGHYATDLDLDQNNTSLAAICCKASAYKHISLTNSEIA